jgi:hypothetical protein
MPLQERGSDWQGNQDRLVVAMFLFLFLFVFLITITAATTVVVMVTLGVLRSRSWDEDVYH